ncbi:hypothetical protein [Thalassotalea ganghwensis]
MKSYYYPIILISLLYSPFSKAENISIETETDKQLLKWNYIEAQAYKADIYNTKYKNTRAEMLKGSYLINENVYVKAYYRSLTQDDRGYYGSSKLDFDTTNVDLGYKLELTQSTEIYAALGYSNKKSQGYYFADLNENGYGLITGIRSLVTTNIELGSEASFTKYSSEKDTAIEVSALYHFSKSFSVGIGYAFTNLKDGYDENIKLGSLSIRYHYL